MSGARGPPAPAPPASRGPRSPAPSRAVPLARVGLHFHLKEFHKALDAYNGALKLAPESEEAKSGVERVLFAINSANSEEEQQARAQRSMQDPEIQAILQNPTMRNVLSAMQDDPKSANKYLADPEIKANIEKLIAAGVLSMK